MSNRHSSNYCWWIENDDIVIVTSSDLVNFSDPPTDGVKARLIYTGLATHFTEGASLDITETSEIPAQFHDGLISGLMWKLHEEKGRTPDDIQWAIYWKNRYEEILKKAKKYANSEKTFGNVHDIAPANW